MISLRDLIEDLVHGAHTLWRTKRGFSAKNPYGKRHYFPRGEKNAEKAARKWSVGGSKKGRLGRPQPKERPVKHEPKQRYSA